MKGETEEKKEGGREGETQTDGGRPRGWKKG